jgi:tetratricopeptide (TPR) repeat protein
MGSMPGAEHAVWMDPMAPGRVIAERFELEREAGQGGMGTVHRARDLVTGEPVAIKVLQRQTANEIERFAREARMLAELQHPGIVRYVADGTTPDGSPWLAMEWLEGYDLETRLQDKGVTAGESLTMCQRIAEALHVAHGRGVVHRDLKPSNIYLRHGSIETPVVLDFGVAHLDFGATRATRAGAILGTLGYMAPEQARGDLRIDARADVFALGCILFECLTGRAAFLGETVMAVLAKVLIAEVPRVRELVPVLPEALDDLVARMLAKEPSARPSSAASLVRELSALVTTDEAACSRPSMPTLPPPSITAGEQRLVSVLVVGPDRAAPARAGADALAATITPEQARGPLSAIAERFGGRLELLADGSAVVVTSGIGAATDQARRAAQCALAIRAEVDRRIALATGRGDLSQRMPVGEVIDRASALLARPVEGKHAHVRIDEVTAGLLDAHFDVGADKGGLVLRRERALVATSRTVLGHETPCVGRERELHALTGMLAECVDEGVARVVLVTAPAGAGKSRLRAELLADVARKRAVRPVDVWLGRGDPISAGSPFGVLAHALRRVIGLLDGEPRDAQNRRLRARVARYVLAADVSRVSAFLAELVGASLPDGPEDESRVAVSAARNDALLMGDQMKRAFLDFIGAECTHGPVLLVLEDLHWGDGPTVKLVDAALRTLADLPFMVLALARPDVQELFPRLFEERGVLHLHLGELSKKASEKLVRAVLGPSVDARVVAHVVERGQGNPFYLEELIRVAATRPLDDAPDTVLAMVQARLESLEPEARRVLRAASVFGDVFWISGVASLLGSGQRTGPLQAFVDELVEREVIVRRGDGKFGRASRSSTSSGSSLPPMADQEFAFRHALVREAAYAMLPEADRTLGHRLAGEWLERVGEQDARILAEHYERGGELARAARWWRRAAADGLESNDLVTTIARVERGLACHSGGDSPEPALEGELLWLATEAHHWRGENELAEARGLKALECLPRGSAAAFAVLGKVAAAAGKLGHHDRLVSLVRSAGAPPPHEMDALAAYVTAMAPAAAQLLYHGDYALAGEVLDALDRVSTETTLPPTAAGWVDDARATRAMLAGDMAACVTHMERAAACFERASDLRNACIQRGYVGYGQMELGLYTEAESSLRQALEVGDRLGIPTTVASAKHNLGLALARLGKIEEACAVEREAIEMFAAQGNRRLEAASRHYLALILMACGEHRAAEESARAALDVGELSAPMRATSLGGYAAVLVALGRPAEALAPAREAVRILDELGTLEEGEVGIRLAHAEALAASGDAEGARGSIALAREKVLAAAAKLSDARIRQSFLERVPVHVRTLALAAEWGV